MTIDSALIKTIFRKIAKFDKKKGIHENGDGNNYPETVEAMIQNSVTASQAANICASYIAGKAFPEHNDVLVHKGEQISLLRFTQDIADSFAQQNGVYIHVNYNLNYEISDMKVLPFSDCRVGRKDSNRYAGKILVCEDWSDKKARNNVQIVDVYNPNKKVIQAQIDEAGSIEKYNGQILFFHFGKYTYPLSKLHPCIEDADSERQVSVYKNKSLRKGFFGKMLVVTKPLVEKHLDTESEDYKKQLNDRKAFRDTIQEFIGAENVDGVMHFEMEFETDKLEDSILFKQIESNIDDKLFAHTETSVSDNIRMCFNNVPAQLIRAKEGALFGASGDAIQAMKEFYQEQTSDERLHLEQIVNRLMKHHVNKLEDLKITPLIQEKAQPLENQNQ